MVGVSAIEPSHSDMRLTLAFAALALAAFPALAADADGSRWWAHVETLAGPQFEGRMTGTAGYDRAADYAARAFAAYGLQPAGTEGYLQPMTFTEQTVLADRSSAALVAGGEVAPLEVGPDLLFGARIPQPEAIEAPLVFIGYGLHLPEVGYDDFAGQDLKGKIAVYVNGGPGDIAAELKSHSRGSETWRAAQAAGAVGLISIANPKSMDVPWARQVQNSNQPGMYPADAALNEVREAKLSAAFNPAQAEKLFARSGHSFAEVLALADAARPIAGFDLAQSIRAQVATRTRQVTSANVVAKLPGRDPALAAEHVVVTAHLDHLGLNTSGEGPAYYPGALDNAAGAASVLEIARDMAAAEARPQRSVLFVLLTGEEKGLLGSRHFAGRPSVPADSVVADLNMDMILPLWNFDSVLMYGVDESTLGDTARRVSKAAGLQVVADPYPDRNSFIRSDQYSFIRAGIPALAFKFGFKPGTPQAQIESAWRASRYHALTDDLSQPVEKAQAARFNAFLGKLIFAVADGRERPRWKETSFFKRFGK
jgi:Zn-dependent M28 family amino/carboxypeptidase